MALNVPVGQGIASYVFQYGSDPEPMFCTLGVQAVTAPLDADHVTRLESAWRAQPLGLMVPTIALIRTSLRVRQDDGSDIIYERVPSSAAPGRTAGTGLPPNSAMIVEKITNRGGRRGRGRMFVPGIPEASIGDEGLVTGTAAVAWNQSLAAYLVALAAAAIANEKPVIPRLMHGNSTTTTRTSGTGTRTVTVTQGAAGPLPDTITAMVVDQRVGTQRRRVR